MKIKQLSFVALSALLAFSACNKDNDNPGDTSGAEETSLFIRLEQPTQTRGDVPTVVGQKTELKSGAIFITKADGEIIYPSVFIGDGSGSTVPVTKLTNEGITLTKVPKTAHKVYIIGNQDLSVGGFVNISDVFDETVTIEEQGDAVFGISNATLYGDALLKDSTDPLIDKEADVTIKPLISRLELKELEGDNTGAVTNDEKIKSYTVDGIYINNFSTEIALNGNYTGSYEDFGSIPANYHRDDHPSTPGQYKAAWHGYLFDDGGVTGTGIGGLGVSDAALKHAATGFYGYNVFPTVEAYPHIIVRFSDVTDEDGNMRPNTVTGKAGEAFLTVNRYLDPVLGSIVTLDNGYVYQIDNLKFKMSDLTDVPEPGGGVVVLIKASVMEWKVKKVSGGIDNGQ